MLMDKILHHQFMMILPSFIGFFGILNHQQCDSKVIFGVVVVVVVVVAVVVVVVVVAKIQAMGHCKH